MKKMFIILTSLFLFACNNEKKEAEKKVKYSDLSNEMLKGNIQVIEEMPYNVDSAGKAGEMDSCCIEVTDFDENGNAVKFTSKDSKGIIKNQSVFSRDESGLWTGSTDTKEGGKPSGSMKVDVDNKGKYTIARAYDSTGKLDVYYTTIGQNEFGQVLGWKQYDKDSVFRMQGESVYDQARQISYSVKDSVGKLKSSGTSKYNDKGEQTESSNTNVGKDSTTTKVTRYTYDAHDEIGNWTQRTTLDEKGKPIKITKRIYTYKKEG